MGKVSLLAHSFGAWGSTILRHGGILSHHDVEAFGFAGGHSEMSGTVAFSLMGQMITFFDARLDSAN